MRILILLVGICAASWSDDLLISTLIDPEHESINEDERHCFMTDTKTVEEIDKILDRLPFLYMKHFGEPFLIESPKKLTKTLPYIGEFVDSIPATLHVKFVLLPPGQLRQEIVDRKSVQAVQIFQFLSNYNRLYEPYVEALKKDMKMLIEEMSKEDVDFVDRLVVASMSDFEMMGTLDGFLVLILCLMNDLVEKRPVLVAIRDKLRFEFDHVQSPLIESAPRIQSAIDTGSCESGRGIKRSFMFCDRYSSCVFGHLPTEVENIILSQTGLNMRLVCKASSHSNVIPDGPINPIKFLSMMESDGSKWIMLAYVCVDTHPYISKPDVEMIKLFLKTFSACSSDLAIVWEQLESDRDLVIQRSYIMKNDQNDPYCAPDSVQYCVLASLVFEIGAFGEDCDQSVRDQLLAVAKVFFPKQVNELTAARKQHYNSDIDKLFMDPRVPWYWTFAVYSTLTLNGNRSIARILSGRVARNHLLKFQKDKNLRNDTSVTRLLHTRLCEAQKIFNLVELCAGYDIFGHFSTWFSDVRSTQERLQDFLEGCEIGEFHNLSFLSGPQAPAFLIYLLERAFDSSRYKSSRKNYMIGFCKAIEVASRFCVPVEEIFKIINVQPEDYVQQLFEIMQKYNTEPLVEAMCTSKMTWFPDLIVKLYSDSIAFFLNLAETYIYQMLRNGASFKAAIEFISKLAEDEREVIDSLFQDHFPTFPVIQGLQKLSPIRPTQDLILIRIMHDDAVEVPISIFLPKNATNMELYCRLAERMTTEYSLALVRDGAVLMPDNCTVEPLANKKLFISRDKAMVDSVRAFLNL